MEILHKIDAQENSKDIDGDICSGSVPEIRDAMRSRWVNFVFILRLTLSMQRTQNFHGKVRVNSMSVCWIMGYRA